MKKVYLFAIMIAAAIAFTACGNKTAQDGENAEGAATEQTAEATDEVNQHRHPRGMGGPCHQG